MFGTDYNGRRGLDRREKAALDAHLTTEPTPEENTAESIERAATIVRAIAARLSDERNDDDPDTIAQLDGRFLRQLADVMAEHWAPMATSALELAAGAADLSESIVRAFDQEARN